MPLDFAQSVAPACHDAAAVPRRARFGARHGGDGARRAEVLAAPVRPRMSKPSSSPRRPRSCPGEPITVALRLVLEKGWHTYWRNPGDSGLPTTLAWTLPAGVEAGPIEWPAPRVLPVGPLVNYGYEGDALHLVQLSAEEPRLGRARRLPLGARRLARVQGSVHSGRRGPDARVAGRGRRAAGSALGSGARRRARRAAAAACRMARHGGGPGHDDRGDVRAAGRGCRSRNDSLSSRTTRTGSIPPEPQPAAREGDAVVLKLPVAADALGSARQARRRGHRRRRIRHRARRDDRCRRDRQRRRRTARRAGGFPVLNLAPGGDRAAAREAMRSPSRSPSCPRSSAASSST